MKKQYLTIIFALSFASACSFSVSTGTNSTNTTAANTASANTTASPSAENKANTASANTSQNDTALSFETFTEFPKEVDGCSCTFSSSNSDFKAQKYIYVDNGEKFAAIKLNGAMVNFNKTEEKEISKNHWVKKYDSKDYELVVEMTQTGQIDETFQQKGTIKLTKKGGQTITKEVTGECGC